MPHDHARPLPHGAPKGPRHDPAEAPRSARSHPSGAPENARSDPRKAPENPHAHTHNHGPFHLHSHMDPADEAAELQILARQFIDGFREAADKAAYLRIAGIPLEIRDVDGGPPLKLVDVSLTTEWQVGTASPGFGSRELSYLPFPGEMISERTNMGFVYVSLDARRVVDLRDALTDRPAAPLDPTAPLR